MHRIWSVLFTIGTLFIIACAPSAAKFALKNADQQTAPRPSDETQMTCEEAIKKSGQRGERFTASDGVSLYFERGGPTNGSPVVFLHGGPGYNAYAFRKAVGATLEAHLPVVYLDQRGCGRSWATAPGAEHGMARTVQDLDELRQHLNTSKLRFIAHSFGGLVALEYVKKHPHTTESMILIDIAPDLAAAFDHQVQFARLMTEQNSAERAKIDTILAKSSGAFARLMEVYQFVGVKRLQGAMHYASAQGQTRNEGFDAESGLGACAPFAAVSALASSGYLDSRHEDLQHRIPVPATLFAGSKSEVVGQKNIDAAAITLGAELQWFKSSGHFVYIEEPELFVERVRTFFRST